MFDIFESVGRFFGVSLEGNSWIGGFTQGKIEGVIAFFVEETVLEDLRNDDSCSDSWSVDAALVSSECRCSVIRV